MQLLSLLFSAALAQSSFNCQEHGPVKLCVDVPAQQYYVYYNTNTGYIGKDFDVSYWISVNENQGTRGMVCDPRQGGICLSNSLAQDPLFNNVHGKLDFQLAFFNHKNQWDSIYGANYRFTFQ
ncbi:hypothetical protein HDV06_003173 [Boothiomyces sp. JEL0866]|nr:hypothetical protein HDV06_003173 [Boothiomyces sp. JEL0866]